jgi:hypothetical protein
MKVSLKRLCTTLLVTAGMIGCFLLFDTPQYALAASAKSEASVILALHPRTCKVLQRDIGQLGYAEASLAFGEGWAEEGGSAARGESVLYHLVYKCISRGYYFDLEA